MHRPGLCQKRILKINWNVGFDFEEFERKKCTLNFLLIIKKKKITLKLFKGRKKIYGKNDMRQIPIQNSKNEEK